MYSPYFKKALCEQKQVNMQPDYIYIQENIKQCQIGKNSPCPSAISMSSAPPGKILSVCSPLGILKYDQTLQGKKEDNRV